MEFCQSTFQFALPEVRSLAVEPTCPEWPSPGTTDGIDQKADLRARCTPSLHGQSVRKVD